VCSRGEPALATCLLPSQTKVSGAAPYRLLALHPPTKSDYLREREVAVAPRSAGRSRPIHQAGHFFGLMSGNQTLCNSSNSGLCVSMGAALAAAVVRPS
jgi:hypothetical protein